MSDSSSEPVKLGKRKKNSSGKRKGKRGTSTCQRHDLSLKYATVNVNIHCKLRHSVIPEFKSIPDWRRVLCWKYKSPVMGPGGFLYASIFDAMKAEKIRFVVDQLDIHSFLEFLRKQHTCAWPRDVIVVSDDNFLSQNNMTLNHAIWDIVRRKILYGYLRQRIRRDEVFAYIANVLSERDIMPILFYPHSNKDTYYYGKLRRMHRDTTYQKSTLRKKQDISIEQISNEVRQQENQDLVIGQNMYGKLLMQAIQDHNLHVKGRILNLRASRKLRTHNEEVMVPSYPMEYVTTPESTEINAMIDDLFQPIDNFLPDPRKYKRHKKCAKEESVSGESISTSSDLEEYLLGH